jgi:peptidoglycan/LPS O-acetylase OafA/YrhL
VAVHARADGVVRHTDAETAVPDAPAGSQGLGYMPALDGVRAFAVLGVMAFHSGLPFLPAGFLGVDTFFVLSGFLITSLLLGEWGRRATIGLRRFWARRARRLLPALLAVIVFVVLYARYVAAPGTYPDLRADALGALFYSANWHFIAAGGNYFVQTGAVSPLTHTWSLAIEEQFYLLWPLLVLGLLRLTRDLRVLLALCVAGALGSALEMGLLSSSGANLTRLYYGTDTHAQCLLVGAALAVALGRLAGQRAQVGGPATWRVDSRAGRSLLAAVGVAGALGSAALWWRATYTGTFLWRGGFLLAALATAAVLVSVVCAEDTWLARALALGPVRYLGRISYGLYLWHFPLFQWADAARTGLRGYPLFGVRCALTLAVATVSFYAIERPVRHGGLLRRWRAWVAAPVAVAGVAALIVGATAGGVPLSATPRPGQTVPSTAPPVGAPPATTVLLLGDSTAVTFGFGLGVEAGRYHAVLVNQAIIECGVAEVTDVQTGQSVEPPGPACRPGTPADEQWPALWTADVNKFRPAVVAILVGRWEVSNVEWNGGWTNILSAPFADYVAQQLQLAVDIASAQGAHVALLTAPCYDSGEQPDGNAWPADAANRLSVYNRIVRQVAAANPTLASVVDLDGVVCPGGRYVANLANGVPVRAPDGVHFPWFTVGQPGVANPDTLAQVDQFGAWIGPRIWPQLVGRV